MKQQSSSTLDTIQYILGIAYLFLIGLILITGGFREYLLLSLGILTVQLILSIVRFKLLHIIFEVLLMIFSVVALISFIPIFLLKILAWLLLIPVFIIGMLDLVTFKSKGMYQQVYMRTPNFGFKQNTQTKKKSSPSMPKKKKKPEGVVDVDFEEK